MTKYRRKPTTIEAVQWTGTDESAIQILEKLNAAFINWEGAEAKLYTGKDGAQGWVKVPVGHWIAKASDNDFYPIDPDVFAQTYEAVDD